MQQLQPSSSRRLNNEFPNATEYVDDDDAPPPPPGKKTNVKHFKYRLL